ncbi:MAG TPA: hypothetical protein VF284_12310, partial [Rhodanobacteraceae bacterium]
SPALLPLRFALCLTLLVGFAAAARAATVPGRVVPAAPAGTITFSGAVVVGPTCRAAEVSDAAPRLGACWYGNVAVRYRRTLAVVSRAAFAHAKSLMDRASRDASPNATQWIRIVTYTYE